jgi:hypothetical protein
MKIEIDDECMDEIIRGALMNTYLELTEKLKDVKKNPEKYDEDDIRIYNKVVAAIKDLGEWYFFQFDKCVEKAKKAKKK